MRIALSIAIPVFATASVLFGILGLQDQQLLLRAFHGRYQEAELRHRINVFCNGTWSLLSAIAAINAAGHLYNGRRNR